jgi:hypothetical protein
LVDEKVMEVLEEAKELAGNALKEVKKQINK